MSKFMFWRLDENSTIESIHSPNPRTHCSLCSTTPLQKMSLPSIGLDLRLTTKHPLITLRITRGFKRLLIIAEPIKNEAAKPPLQSHRVPVRQAQHEELQEGRLEQQVLVWFRQIGKPGNLFCPSADDLHGCSEEVVELLDVLCVISAQLVVWVGLKLEFNLNMT